MKILHYLVDSFLHYGDYFFAVWCVFHVLIAIKVLSGARSYEVFVGMRYLRSKRKQVVISVITVLSVLGVTLGVAALIAVHAGMSGFEKDIRDKILGANSQLSLIHYQDGIEDWPAVMDQIMSIDGVGAGSPYVERQVLAMHEDRTYGIMFRGVDTATVWQVSDIQRAFEEGSGSLKDLDREGDLPGIALGQDLSYRLRAYQGDEISILNPQGALGPFGLRPEVRRYKVVGVFQFGLWEIDSNVALVNLEEAARFAHMEDRVNGISIKLFDSMKVEKVSAKLKEMFKYPYHVRDWEEINRPLFVALKLEKVLSAWVLGVMVIIASFSIVITLIMIVMEKYRDIAVLKTMGASDSGIRNIFLIHGMITGLLGTVLGVLIGGGLVYSQYRWHWITLDPSVYYIGYLPVDISVLNVFKIAVFALSITFYATLYPSRSAARMDPAEALRYE